ncbi:MAG: hypothetical protein P0Y56_01640 [Candidatus Andeanibacterium colombiense]|uniref:Uncharacterized protein n=1 Tax=Candidatus Andeanibacterium colombiense TaxID=3121345 RepID=A0AAJ5X7F1_9SPHN|nr:MAG: hypothetical protein P0Y56_01640 [Sphingomonadaceae bacterium]
MRHYLIVGLIGTLAAAALTAEAPAEVPSRFELGLDCAAAATVSTMLLKQTKAPAAMQESYASTLASVGGMLHDLAPAAGMTDAQVDLEITRRSNVLVDSLNATPDDGYQAAVLKQVSLEPDGGMGACTTLLNEVRIEKKP